MLRNQGLSAACLVALSCVGGCRACSAREADDAALHTETSPTEVADAHQQALADNPDVDSPIARCPPEMARIDHFCIDRYEAHVVVVDAEERERPHSPFHRVAGLRVRAKSTPGVVPQAYISQKEAASACAEANKRLCREGEFLRACKGPSETNLYPYGGTERERGACNEGKGSMIPRFYGNDPAVWKYADFNDPRLNQEPHGLAKTGTFTRCVTPEGVYDLVGNLHEWNDDEPDERGRGRFRGGFYGDAEVNGHGCAYVTKAHEIAYHDYSTGFRCCALPKPAPHVP